MPYAEKTNVSSERSRNEIERVLARYGADQFVSGWDRERAVLGFVAHGRQVRFYLPMPDRQSKQFRLTPTGKVRAPGQVEAAYEQVVRQRWRALLLIVKAKLEAVESGIVSFEQEFLAHTMLPNGQTMTEWVEPQIEKAYQDNEMPALLPGVRAEIES